MSEDYNETFKKILQEAKENPNIIGLILGGSRGKGFNKDYSDYDFQVIVKDEADKEYKTKIELLDENPLFDCGVLTLDEFKEYAEMGSGFEWARYDFTRNKALIDKTNGILQKLIDEKGKIPEKEFEDYISGYLDGYINSVYRSLKCLRDGYNLGFRLEAVDSIRIFLACAFAIHDRRLVPYYKYLEFELHKYPLNKFP